MIIKKGIFITFEGCDGSGKTTQLDLLVRHIKTSNNFGYAGVIAAREPGGSNISESIRKIVLDPDYKVAPLAELLLYEANRAQNVKDFIIPHLERNFIVICDRFTDSTTAYQGYARGLALAMIETLNNIASYGLKPDLTLFLDFPIKTSLLKARGLKKDSYENGDRIERESLGFHKKVRKGFLAIAKNEPERIKVIKVAGKIQVTHERITEEVRKALFLKTLKEKAKTNEL